MHATLHGCIFWIQKLAAGICIATDYINSQFRRNAKPILENSIILLFIKVLLLDEPAGGMDSDLEAHLIDALERRRGTMTCVIVTHRPSLMRRTDAVIFLNAGNAVMRDTAELEQAAS